MGRVERDPFVPGAGQEAQVGRRVDRGQRRVESAVVRQLQLAERTPAQFGQHLLEPVGHLVAVDQPTAEHLLPAVVQVVHRVVDDQHAATAPIPAMAAVWQSCRTACRGCCAMLEPCAAAR